MGENAPEPVNLKGGKMLKIYGEKEETNLALLDGPECCLPNNEIGLCVVNENGKLVTSGILLVFEKKTFRVKRISGIKTTLGFELASDNKLVIHDY